MKIEDRMRRTITKSNNAAGMPCSVATSKNMLWAESEILLLVLYFSEVLMKFPAPIPKNGFSFIDMTI